jgi:acyl carrier protein
MPEQTAHDVLFDEVHKQVLDVIKDVVGEDFFEESEIELDSSFAEDIELESMEILQIGEQLIGIYEDRVDFIQWLADMDLKQIVDLTLRDFVNFIVSELEEHPQRETADN